MFNLSEINKISKPIHKFDEIIDYLLRNYADEKKIILLTHYVVNCLNDKIREYVLYFICINMLIDVQLKDPKMMRFHYFLF